MKNTLYITLVCLSIIPARAQKAASESRPASGETAATLVQDYADTVNGLLRDVHANLRQISERMESGALTPQQAQELKLAATREMIARLETLSAVYDNKIASLTSAGERCALDSRVSNDATTQAMRMRLTVNVRALETATTQAVGQ